MWCVQWPLRGGSLVFCIIQSPSIYRVVSRQVLVDCVAGRNAQWRPPPNSALLETLHMRLQTVAGPSSCFKTYRLTGGQEGSDLRRYLPRPWHAGRRTQWGSAPRDDQTSAFCASQSIARSSRSLVDVRFQHGSVSSHCFITLSPPLFVIPTCANSATSGPPKILLSSLPTSRLAASTFF